MGIFSRFKDIVSSNINSMLDKAEDPEKMIRLMIQEMEETLVELKAGCAGLMADHKRIERERSVIDERVALWDSRAVLAMQKGREDLAREALVEKHGAERIAGSLEEEQERFSVLIEQAREDIQQLETKLDSARDRQRSLVKRHARADQRKRVRSDVRRAQSADAMLRFDRFEQRVERLEAEAELAGPGAKGSLDDAFAQLEGSDAIEVELAALRENAKTASASKKSGK